MNNIKRVSKSQAYDAYLSEREKGDNKYNPTFYIDVAEYFITFNRALALQILSNIADLSLESAYLYKALMYYFKQYEAFDDCLYAAKKINDWRPFEPQSHRDLALAYELVGNIDNAAK
jgi:Ca-activated chloride channel family protein